MASLDTKVKASWADQMEENEEEGEEEEEEEHEDKDNSLPATTVVIDGDNKIVTEYRLNESGKKVKVIRYYKIVKIHVPKSVAKRKNWKKFGAAANDPPGPNPATTIIAEEVFMQFIGTHDEPTNSNESGDDALNKLKTSGKGMVKCRHCRLDHWTLKCPYKDKLGELNKEIASVSSIVEANVSANTVDETAKPGKYVPPNMRDGGNKRGVTMVPWNKRDDANTIRVTNLSKEIQDQELRELFEDYGKITRLFLAKDKITGESKGFAFVSFEWEWEAEDAIEDLNGSGYEHLILKVEWAKPSTN